MKRTAPALIFVAVLASCFVAVAQDSQIGPGSERPMFTRIKPSLRSPRNQIEAATTGLQTWNGSFKYNGTTYNYNMVGVPPFPSSSATVTTYIVPVKIVLSNGMTFDPSPIVQNTLSSPIFTSSVDFKSGMSGSVDMGTTQYIDAFQRANFWGTAGNPSHLLLSATIKPEQTLTVPKRYGSTGVVFGFRAGLVDINYFNSKVPSMITAAGGIAPNTFVIFLTYDVYLTQNHSCCIGGYHSASGVVGSAQSYAHATYIDHAGAFAEDVSALSHEVGECADDPLVNNSGNPSPCGGSLEVGDPLENDVNFGTFPYTSGGFTYHLQDLVTLPYFGAPTNTSVDGEFTFQNGALGVCQNGA